MEEHRGERTVELKDRGLGRERMIELKDSILGRADGRA